MKIAHKLVLLVALPLIGLSFLGWRAFSDTSSVANEMGKLQSLTQIASQVSTLVHETQKERGMTAGFLGSKGAKFGPELAGQRGQADKQAQSLTKIVNSTDMSSFPQAFTGELSSAMSQFESLRSIRSGVDAQTIKTSEAIGAYTKMNGSFLDAVAQMTKLSSEGSMSVKLSAYVSYLKGKERAGIERAVMSNVFAADAFGPGQYQMFVGLVTEQDTYFREFQAAASPELAAKFGAVLNSSISQEVTNYRELAHSKVSTGGFETDSAAWFASATSRIGEIRALELELSEDIASTADTMRSSATSARLFISGVVGALIVGAIVICSVIGKAITKPIATIVSRIEEIAKGDLTKRVEIKSNDELGQLGRSFDGFVKTLHNAITEVSESSTAVASAAGEIAASSDQMASGLANQQEQTTQVSAAVEEMSSTVSEVSLKSTEAADAAQKSGAEATEGGQVVSQTVDEMGGISEQVNIAANAVSQLGRKGEQIGEIIGVINDIADQTNLLALNAAIEAARAGEHGRGFAVVADEVRKLAERTTDATEEVGKSIRDIQNETGTAVTQIQAGTERVGKGVELASAAGEALSRIVDGSHSLQSMVQSIAAASEEQSAASTQIARSVEQIDSVTRESLEGARQAANAATDLSEQAEGLQKLVSKFTI